MKVNKMILASVLIIGILSASMTAAASSGINANEQAVLNFAKGTFELDGKYYKVRNSYINQAYNYMNKDGVDFTAAQKNEAIAQAKAMVAEGVSKGYLYEVQVQATTAPTSAPTAEPEVTASPTEKPSSTTSPTQKPSSTTSPTKKPSATTSPTKKPSSTLNPSGTQAPDSSSATGNPVTGDDSNGNDPDSTVVPGVAGDGSNSGGTTSEIIKITSSDTKRSTVELLSEITELAKDFNLGVTVDAATKEVKILEESGNTIFVNTNPIKATGFQMNVTLLVTGLLIITMIGTIFVTFKFKLFATEDEE